MNLTVLKGDGSREGDDWDEGQGVTQDKLRAELEDGLANADRVIVFTFKRGPDGSLAQTTVALQRRSLRVTWVEAYGAMMAWLHSWASKSW